MVVRGGPGGFEQTLPNLGEPGAVLMLRSSRAPTLVQLTPTTGGLLRGLGARQVSMLARRLAGGTREAPGSPRERTRTPRAREEPTRSALVGELVASSMLEVVFRVKMSEQVIITDSAPKTRRFSASSFRSSPHPSPKTHSRSLSSRYTPPPDSCSSTPG